MESKSHLLPIFRKRDGIGFFELIHRGLAQCTECLPAAVLAAWLAEQSCRIEIDICGEPIGRQDQYAAAFGGLSFIQFHPDDRVSVDPILCGRETTEALQKNTLVFFTGQTRSASKILKTQNDLVEQDRAKQEVLIKMVGLAHDLKDRLQRNDLGSFGEILHENWILKKSLTDQVSN
ncbi:MAG: hypothetical protein V9E94_21080 [Microthrixaceae bacterium]